MARLPLTFACGPYDRMEALSLGVIQPEGIDLRYIAIQSPPEIFARMVKTRSFDAAEMSLAHYIVSRIRGSFPFVAIPVFPSRVFRHGYVFINRHAGIVAPKDLEGRRIGVQEYRQTAGVWVRGILADEYGIDLAGVRWLEGGVNTPRKPDDDMDLRPVRPLALELIPADRTLNDMLEAGGIDAHFRAPRADAPGFVGCGRPAIPYGPHRRGMPMRPIIVLSDEKTAEWTEVVRQHLERGTLLLGEQELGGA